MVVSLAEQAGSTEQSSCRLQSGVSESIGSWVGGGAVGPAQRSFGPACWQARLMVVTRSVVYANVLSEIVVPGEFIVAPNEWTGIG